MSLSSFVARDIDFLSSLKLSDGQLQRATLLLRISFAYTKRQQPSRTFSQHNNNNNNNRCKLEILFSQKLCGRSLKIAMSKTRTITARGNFHSCARPPPPPPPPATRKRRIFSSRVDSFCSPVGAGFEIFESVRTNSTLIGQ
ncbi:hypothetical protein T07_7072 [Trichinella nelsoni]|uniref:Uncharacterized protein n=1 Tax=Trichinella nelsoni TaxID=6336 RepID=A0A0V0SKL5_9BILA|nr:hypothetical protein T07_7072 [Trichinella nelsoni]